MPKIQLNVSSDDVRPRLEALAEKFGFMWGDSPNVSKFVEAIAQGEIDLIPELNSDQIQAFLQALHCLQQQGQVQVASSLVKLLYKFKLSKTTSLELDRLLDIGLGLQLLAQISDFISERQPFHLSYQDAAGRVWTYTVRYAQISYREKRNYLECWCEETEGNQDLPELQHNWSLRLDRINDAGLVPIDGEWRGELDTVDVNFELFGGLAYGYREREADIEVEPFGVEPYCKRVVRRISNTFWFIREILPYGKDCVVLKPKAIRQKVKEHLEAACSLYE